MAEQITDNIRLDGLEWRGKLAGSAGRGSLFSLYLAMHASGSDPVISIREDEHEGRDLTAALISLNHYRRAPLAADDNSATKLRPLSEAINSSAFASARLWAAMHPDPLSLTDDVKRIPPEVYANASLAANQRRQQQNIVNVDQDPTLLTDLIDEADQFLVA